jgi:hypothetical protein
MIFYRNNEVTYPYNEIINEYFWYTSWKHYRTYSFRFRNVLWTVQLNKVNLVKD